MGRATRQRSSVVGPALAAALLAAVCVSLVHGGHALSHHEGLGFESACTAPHQPGAPACELCHLGGRARVGTLASGSEGPPLPLVRAAASPSGIRHSVAEPALAGPGPRAPPALS